MNLQQEIKYFRTELQKHTNSKRAKQEKRYLKSPWKFYGVNMPTLTQIVKNWLKTHPQTSPDEITRVAQKLWQSSWHEEKSLAIKLLQQRQKQLSLKHLPLIETMINQATGWDHLDEISAHLVGALIDANPKTLKYLSKWAKSRNFWVRRAALLGQLLQFRRGQGNFKLFEKLAAPMFNEGKNWSKEERFFIRKAIGWVLREASKKRPQQVFNFIKKYKHKMSGLTFREASRKLPPNLQKQLKHPT